MRYLLTFLIVFPLPLAMGCGGSKAVPALSQPGNDPPAEQQKNWMEESRSRKPVASKNKK